MKERKKVAISKFDHIWLLLSVWIFWSFNYLYCYESCINKYTDTHLRKGSWHRMVGEHLVLVMASSPVWAIKVRSSITLINISNKNFIVGAEWLVCVRSCLTDPNQNVVENFKLNREENKLTKLLFYPK